jgi:hypothetical protein
VRIRDATNKYDSGVPNNMLNGAFVADEVTVRLRVKHAQ